MRLHSSVLTEDDITKAAFMAGARARTVEEHGSRSRARSFDVFLTGHGRSGGQWGNTSGLPTASWDEWGMTLAALYKLDPELKLAVYPDHYTFDIITTGRFDDLTPDAAHHYHRWTYDAMTWEHVCGCEATMMTPYNAKRAGLL